MVKRDTVADRDDVGRAGEKIVVDHDAVCDRQPGIGGELGIGNHADADHRDIGLDSLAGGGLDSNVIDLADDTLEFDAQIVRNRTYDMLIRSDKTDAGKKCLCVKVNRSRRSDQSSSSALSISIDFRELAERAASVIDGYLVDYRALKNRYGKYLRPGTLLASELETELDHRGLNHMSEVFDGDPPHGAGGTIAQAWNTAELLRSRDMLAHGRP